MCGQINISNYSEKKMWRYFSESFHWDKQAAGSPGGEAIFGGVWYLRLNYVFSNFPTVGKMQRGS